MCMNQGSVSARRSDKSGLQLSYELAVKIVMAMETTPDATFLNIDVE